jgi:hypothetical protein
VGDHEDEQPRPLRMRATRARYGDWRPRPAPPVQKASSPIGAMIGCLVAGAWCLIFFWWFQLTGAFLWIVAGLGFVLCTLGMVLGGLVIGEALEQRSARRPPRG